MLRVNSEDLDLGYDTKKYCDTYKGEPFTGIMYSIYDDGSIEWEKEYKNGYGYGPFQSWYPSGKLSKKGIHQGCHKEWFEDGNVKKEVIAEFGVVLYLKEWNENGELINEYKRNEDMYSYLLALREKHKEIIHTFYL